LFPSLLSKCAFELSCFFKNKTVLLISILLPCPQVTDTRQDPGGKGPVTPSTVADVDPNLADDVAEGAYGRPQPRAMK